MTEDKARDIENAFRGLGGGIGGSVKRKAIQYSYRIGAVERGFELVVGDSSVINDMKTFYEKGTGHSWEDRKSHPEIYCGSDVKDVVYSCRLRAVELGHEFFPGDRSTYSRMLEDFKLFAGHPYQGELVQ